MRGALAADLRSSLGRLSACLWVALAPRLTVWAYASVSPWHAAPTGAARWCFVITLNPATVRVQIMRYYNSRRCGVRVVFQCWNPKNLFAPLPCRSHWEALHHARLTCGRQDTVQVDPPYYAAPTQHARSTTQQLLHPHHMWVQKWANVVLHLHKIRSAPCQCRFWLHEADQVSPFKTVSS